MPKAAFLLSLLILLNSSDCDPQKQDGRIAAIEADMKQLKADVAELKQKPKEHHYELRNEGLRTWRFDSATGETCIQLTSEADWKRKETKNQSCACTDNSDNWLQMPKNTDAERASASNYYDWMVKSACGN
jgi:hypothetical protein